MMDFIRGALPWVLLGSGVALALAALRSRKKQSEETDKNYGPMGMCLGMSVGMAIGLSVGQMSLGMSIGMLYGLAIGTMIKGEKSDE